MNVTQDAAFAALALIEHECDMPIQIGLVRERLVALNDRFPDVLTQGDELLAGKPALDKWRYLIERHITRDIRSLTLNEYEARHVAAALGFQVPQESPP